VKVDGAHHQLPIRKRGPRAEWARSGIRRSPSQACDQHACERASRSTWRKWSRSRRPAADNQTLQRTGRASRSPWFRKWSPPARPLNVGPLSGRRHRASIDRLNSLANRAGALLDHCRWASRNHEHHGPSVPFRHSDLARHVDGALFASPGRNPRVGDHCDGGVRHSRETAIRPRRCQITRRCSGPSRRVSFL